MKAVKYLFMTTLFALAGTAFCDWTPAPGKGVMYVTVAEAAAACPAAANGQGWVSFYMGGDLSKPYVFLLSDGALPKGMLSVLLSAQTNGAKVIVNETGSTQCGTSASVIKGIQIMP